MEEEYKNDKDQSDSPVEPKIYDPFSEEETHPLEERNKEPRKEESNIKEKSGAGGYDVRDSNKEGKNVGRTDLKLEAYNDMYSRESQKRKYHNEFQNPQNDGNSSKVIYPELYQRMEKESELLVHFYIKNISSFHHKNETHRKLHDLLQQFGAVKEIALQRINNNIYELGVGMRYDEVARYIVENDKLRSFISSLDRDDIKPYFEPSLIFNLYLKSTPTPTDKTHYDPRKEGKQSVSSHESHRRSGGYGQGEEDHARGHDRSAGKDRHKPSAYGKKGRHAEDGSRSRSRSKSPSGRLASQVDKKPEFDPNKVYQVKDFLNKKKSETLEMPPGPGGPQTQGSQHPSAQLGQSSTEKVLMPGQRPEKPGPPSGQPGVGDFVAQAGKGFTPSPPFYMPPPTAPSKEAAKGQTVEPILDYDNYCLFLGVPSELTEHQIFEALKSQGVEQPIKFEWVEESVTQYLRLGFKSDKTVKELILKEINVGPTMDDLIYPVLILPWLKDKKFDELLVYHQVQVESSIPVDSLFLDLFYSPYGPIADVIDMKPSKHVLIFTKQPHAQHVLSIPQISLQKNNIEIVMKHAVVDSCYPLVRKNLEAHQQTLMTRYIQSVKPSSLTSAAAQEIMEEEHRLEPLYQSPPPQGHREGVYSGSGDKNDQYDVKGSRYPQNDNQVYSPNYRYEDEGYYTSDRDRGGNRPAQFSGQPYRQDKYRYNERMPPRNDFFDGNKRRDNPRNDRNQGYNPRYNQSPREGGEGYGGPGGRPYNNYQQYGRNQEPRQHQYRQNISPEQRGQYHQGRNPDMRPQERGLDYRGHQGKGHEQRQQPPYAK